MMMNKSIEELENSRWVDSDFDSYVVQTVQTARKKLLSELSNEEIRVLTGQKVGLKYVLPMAVAILKRNPLANVRLYEGDLLSCVLRLSLSDWRENPVDFREFQSLLRANRTLIVSCEEISADLVNKYLLQEVTMDFKKELKNEIVKAARNAFQSLFANGEHYYYITLATDGLANTPYISAWSYEAFERVSENDDDVDIIKWSEADSPYNCWEQEHFDKVAEMLAERDDLMDSDDEHFDDEIELRFSAMEEAMKELDSEGLFSKNQPRSEVMVLVEVIPPDYTNTERAYRLNDSNTKIFKEWLDEAAEDEFSE